MQYSSERQQRQHQSQNEQANANEKEQSKRSSNVQLPGIRSMTLDQILRFPIPKESVNSQQDVHALTGKFNKDLDKSQNKIKKPSTAAARTGAGASRNISPLISQYNSKNPNQKNNQNSFNNDNSLYNVGFFEGFAENNINNEYQDVLNNTSNSNTNNITNDLLYASQKVWKKDIRPYTVSPAQNRSKLTKKSKIAQTNYDTKGKQWVNSNNLDSQLQDSNNLGISQNNSNVSPSKPSNNTDAQNPPLVAENSLLMGNIQQKVRGVNGLNVKVLEQWINSTISESAGCGSEALREFGLERHSLQGKGVARQSVDRLYRCLFIYTYGFYAMINDIFQHSNDTPRLVANVWKVYAILLEYCQRQEFVNTVAQLEKEKNTIVGMLQNDIIEKQSQFDKLECIEKEKRDGLEMQILALKQQQQNFLNEKFQLEEDFKLADQAFNEEVSLRLQFEHKINELHSIHRELLVKHNRLIDELDGLQTQHNYLKNTSSKQQQEIDEIKKSSSITSNENRTLVLKVQELNSQVEKMKIRSTGLQAELDRRIKGTDAFETMYYVKSERRYFFILTRIRNNECAQILRIFDILFVLFENIKVRVENKGGSLVQYQRT